MKPNTVRPCALEPLPMLTLLCAQRRSITRLSSACALSLLLLACGGGGTDTSSGNNSGNNGGGDGGGGVVSTTPRWGLVGSPTVAPTMPAAILPALPALAMVPNDPQYSAQGFLQTANAPNGLGGSYGETANINAAWTLATGAGHAIVIAVIDTGIDASHPDLQGRLLPGYNFLRDPQRNTDITPRGTAACASGQSHGTAVAGTIAANSNNGVGVAGIHAGAKILPIRTSDGCASLSTDIADAVRWAAGLVVDGVPINPNPAKIINISMAGPGNCLVHQQSAIDAAIAVGAIIFAGAGNSGGPVYAPANCDGVIALAKVGTTASGPEVALMTGANGYTTYPNDAYTSFGGTSVASPIAAGVAALVLSLAPDLNAAGMKRVLMASARPFPLVNPYTGLAYSPALTGQYGAGYLDAWRALNYVSNSLIAQIAVSTVASNGSAAALSSTSRVRGTGATIVAYAWTQTSGPVVVMTGATSASASVVFPAGAGTYRFSLTVTDSLGRTDTAVQTISVAN